jgi:ferredoxin-NADP reductase
MTQHARVTGRHHLAPGLQQLNLEAPPGFTFTAGQFIILPVPPPAGAQPGGKPLKGFYSVASAPAALPQLELLVEHREGGGPVSAWVSSRAVGEELGFEGPLGHFGLLPGDGPCVFLGRRAGLAPLRSLVHQALAHGHEAWLFLGGDDPEDWLLHQEWEALALREPRFFYRPALGDGAALAALALAQGLGASARFHLAGFTREIQPAQEALQAAGVPHERLKAERFG